MAASSTTPTVRWTCCPPRRRRATTPTEQPGEPRRDCCPTVFPLSEDDTGARSAAGRADQASPQDPVLGVYCGSGGDQPTESVLSRETVGEAGSMSGRQT